MDRFDKKAAEIILTWVNQENIPPLAIEQEEINKDFTAMIATALREVDADGFKRGMEQAKAILLDRSMREQYVLSGPRCLATAANRIQAALDEEMKAGKEMIVTQENVRNLILKRIKDYPGAKFVDIFDADVKTACAKASPMVAHCDLFRVADRALQALRKDRVIIYRTGGWYLRA